jgi:hypothetical protein
MPIGVAANFLGVSCGKWHKIGCFPIAKSFDDVARAILINKLCINAADA